MPKKQFIITDVSQRIHHSQAKAGRAEVPGADKSMAINATTLAGGLSDGVQLVELACGDISVSVLPTRGMNLWKAARAGGLDYGWDSPIRGPVHPKFVPLGEPSGLGWLDGFDEMLVRCGLESNGAPEFDDNGTLMYPLHGKIGNKPAEKVVAEIDPDAGTVSLTGETYETRFHFLKLKMTSTVTLKLGEPTISVSDTIENLSAAPAEFQLLYHANFGTPLLDAGSQFRAPLEAVVPRNDHAAASIRTWNSYAAPVTGFEEQVYFLKLLGDRNGDTRAMLKNAHATKGVALSFNIKQLPCFTVWKDTAAIEDGYVTGLEPGVNFPNPRTYEGERGRVATLEGGASQQFDLTFHLLNTEAEVAAAEKAINKLQGQTKTQVFDTPQKGWCHGV